MSLITCVSDIGEEKPEKRKESREGTEEEGDDMQRFFHEVYEFLMSASPVHVSVNVNASVSASRHPVT